MSGLEPKSQCLRNQANRLNLLQKNLCENLEFQVFATFAYLNPVRTGLKNAEVFRLLGASFDKPLASGIEVCQSS